MEYSKRFEKSQLSSLKKTKEFREPFYKLVRGDKSLTEKEQEFLLLSSLLLFNFYNKDNRFKSFFRLAYYIIVKYSLLFKSFQPLYDIALQIGFYPICKFLIDKELVLLNSINEKSVFKLIEKKYTHYRDNYVETLEQKNAVTKLLSSQSKNLIYIAPTSYGKSSFITEVLLKNEYSKIGIIVPSKSLLVQTYNSVKSLNLPYKLILHDEMYNFESNIIGILTQERAMRLQRKGVFFDLMFIDEAHKLLEFNYENSRGLILSRVIKLNKLRKIHTKIIYLSPLIDKVGNLKLDAEEKFDFYRIKHNLKCNDIYYFYDNKLTLYEKFTDKELIIEEKISFKRYINQFSKEKNFVYNYRPINIEKLAKALFELDSLPLIKNRELDKIIGTLSAEVHDDFYVNEFLKKGIIYIHAKIPNIIKEYLEHKFKTLSCIKYIVANDVILEGINLPIDNIFITSTYRFNGKKLTNLIGRVNRLNYVFDNTSLEKLNSNIHFLELEEYQGTYSMEKKIKLLRDNGFDDFLQNPLLTNYDVHSLGIKKTKKESQKERIEKREKLDTSIISKTNFLLKDDDTLSLRDQIKKYCIENNIDDFYNNIDYVSSIIENKINAYRKNEKFINQSIIGKIVNIFISKLEVNIKDYELERLKNRKARRYYRNYIEIMQRKTLKENIKETSKFFIQKKASEDPLLYIGKSFGEIARVSEKYNNKEYLNKVYVDLTEKNDNDLINLAIVKLKIEEDFVSFKLNKLINFLYDFKLISMNEYNYHTYGALDDNLIAFSKLGLSVNIVKKLQEDNQINNISFNKYGNLIVKKSFYTYLENQSELFKFEINKYIGTRALY